MLFECVCTDDFETFAEKLTLLEYVIQIISPLHLLYQQPTYAKRITMKVSSCSSKLINRREHKKHATNERAK